MKILLLSFILVLPSLLFSSQLLKSKNERGEKSKKIRMQRKLYKISEDWFNNKEWLYHVNKHAKEFPPEDQVRYASGWRFKKTTTKKRPMVFF